MTLEESETNFNEIHKQMMKFMQIFYNLVL